MKQLGLDLGYAKADQAANSAGDEWCEMAYGAFVHHAKHNAQFTTEQVRNCSGVETPGDLRAWGSIARRAKDENLVVFVGWARAESPRVHGSVISLWESKIYDPLDRL
jgi:hypothetical protein